MAFSVTILGSNSAVPSNGRHPTAQALSIKDHLILIDCGEGTQIQLAKYEIKVHKIEYIFISHLHGDHFFGLIGLITSYNLNQRQKPLTVYGPKGLAEIVQLQLHYSATQLRYELNFVEITPENGKVILSNEHFEVTTVQLNHRIPCSGFIFKEKNTDRKILKEALEEYKIPVDVIPSLKKGADLIMPNGTVVPNHIVTANPPRERSYAFCTDTSYLENIVPYIKEVDLLYHEATFTSDLQDRANETFHSTAKEAATIATKAAVGKLIVGHFSGRYRELDMLLKEAKSQFSNTELALEGACFEVTI
jgi:ribonuclease Z